jgi:succinoglycan biosynthesis transport protein ExoP
MTVPVGPDEPSEGLAIGRALAASMRTVLVATTAGAAESVPGLVQLLRGDCSFVDAIHRDPTSRLHRVSHGPGIADPLSQGPDGLAMVIDALDQTYDCVLVDAPAGTDSTLQAALLTICDAVVVMCRPGQEELAEHRAEALRQAGIAETFILSIDEPRMTATAA